jgi:cytochrome c oxidase assembly factor CtaG/cytochrome c2
VLKALVVRVLTMAVLPAGRIFRCAVLRCAALLMAAPAVVSAHELTGRAPREWEFDPLVVVPLAVALVLYAAGLARVWRRAGPGRGISWWSGASFAAGWIALAVALVSPIAWLSRILFSVHMTQHTLLMLVAAPLLTFGHPLLAWMWALGDRPRDRVARALRAPRLVRAWHVLTAPATVFLLQAAALWVWHIPSWYEAALGDDGIHAIQHLSFVAAGSLFWWAMTEGRYGRSGYGLGVLYVFMTAVHSGGLGALLTFAPAVWYPEYARQAAGWRLDPLADQQLAGLLMWIPAGVVFTVFGLALTAAWLGEAERRVRLGVTGASRTLPMAIAACALAVSACGGSAVVREAETLTGGSVERGRSAIGRYGCAACHTIPGIADARATVGPPLTNIAVRGYLGGHLTNTPANMITWIQHPQQVDPKNVMPEMGVTDQDARDITAYLYTLRQ